MDLQVDFYFSKFDVLSGTWVDVNLERDSMFNFGNTRTRYRKCVGLENKGDTKNIYTETYADNDSSRVHIPSQITKENTKISMSICFFEGDVTEDNYTTDRQTAYQNLYNYLSSGLLMYYDTARKRAAVVYIKESPNISEDMYVKGKPYMEVEFQFVNIYGESPKFNNLNAAKGWAAPIITRALS